MEYKDVSIQTDDPELVPSYGSAEAAGADLRAAILEEVVIEPGAHKLIPTGVKVALPVGFELQIRPRSGLALKNGVTVLNTPGTIDSDYRGEICVILINHSKVPFTITPKMRIAQAVLQPVVRARFVFADDLSATERGGGGFGHTGTH